MFCIIDAICRPSVLPTFVYPPYVLDVTGSVSRIEAQRNQIPCRRASLAFLFIIVRRCFLQDNTARHCSSHMPLMSSNSRWALRLTSISRSQVVCEDRVTDDTEIRSRTCVNGTCRSHIGKQWMGGC